MRVWWFLIFHLTATGGGCFLRLQRFSAPVSVWDKRFPPHAIHGSMLKAHSCGCEGMQSFLFYTTPQKEGYSHQSVGMERRMMFRPQEEGMGNRLM